MEETDCKRNDLHLQHKRLKLSHSLSSDSIRTAEFPNGRDNQNTNTGSEDTRASCEYGIKCYRINPDHFQLLRHPHLEDILTEMEKTGNRTEVPQKFMKHGVDRRKVLEQIIIMRNRKNTNPAINRPSSSSSSLSTSTSTPSTSYSEAIADARERRKQQFLDSKKVSSDHATSGGNSHSQNKTNSTHCSNQTKRSMKDIWEASCPFNFLLTKVAGISEEPEGIFSASFKDLFDLSLGEVKVVLHVNFMVEPEWLMEQTIQTQLEGKPTRIIFDGASKDLQGMSEAFSWIKVFGVKSPFPFGHHHTKMTIVQYTDSSIRFYIYTANLIESDWAKRTQGIWISPRCPKITTTLSTSVSSGSSGDSVTKFKADIIQYFSTYPVQSSRAWIDEIRNVDCSAIKVFFVASAPNTTQSGSSGFQWGLCKMKKVLKSIDLDTDPLWSLIIQCSSIGTLGKGLDEWVNGELALAFSGKDRLHKGPISLVYPTHNNVKTSFEGMHGGGCLPYSAQTHMKQPWLNKHFCQWKADRSGRSRAPPHIKSYLRVSPDNSQLAWILLTSANLSKAAWGKLSKNHDRLTVMSWAAGILFAPSILLVSDTHFTINQGGQRSATDFPLHIDIPVTKYEKEDRPWFIETLQAMMLQERESDSD